MLDQQEPKSKRPAGKLVYNFNYFTHELATFRNYIIWMFDDCFSFQTQRSNNSVFLLGNQF